MHERTHVLTFIMLAIVAVWCLVLQVQIWHDRHREAVRWSSQCSAYNRQCDDAELLQAVRQFTFALARLDAQEGEEPYETDR